VLVSLGVDLTSVRCHVIQLLSGYQGREGAAAPGPSSAIGDTWTVEVIRAGTAPATYAAAHQAI